MKKKKKKFLQKRNRQIRHWMKHGFEEGNTWKGLGYGGLWLNAKRTKWKIITTRDDKKGRLPNDYSPPTFDIGLHDPILARFLRVLKKGTQYGMQTCFSRNC